MKKIKKLIFFILIINVITTHASTMDNKEEYKACKAECYEQHTKCLAVCDKQRENAKKTGKRFNYNQCRNKKENKECLPALNTCVTTKCHPFFKA